MAKNKKPIQVQHPKQRVISQEFNPDSHFSCSPSWKYSLIDKEKWTIMNSESAKRYCMEVIPRLSSYEKQKWSEIKSSKKQNHSINVLDLNPGARKRLDSLQIEAESLFSLRISGTIRVYGLIETDGSFEIIWVDFDHGDNPTCVCRAIKKHT